LKRKKGKEKRKGQRKRTVKNGKHDKSFKIFREVNNVAFIVSRQQIPKRVGNK
jgi:hypothetical protein